jgi:hypothetical protein
VIDLDADLIEDLRALGISVRQVRDTAEFWVAVEGDRFNVYQGSDDGEDPEGWYADLVPELSEGSEEIGPYDSAESLIQDVFIDENI